MTFPHAIFLGIIEGLTEFIHVSSTGHLILASHFLRDTGETVKVFEIFIQLGAILAVIAAYPAKFMGFLNFKKGPGFSGVRALTLLLITTLPAFVLGFLAHGFIKNYLFNTQTVALALAAGGVWILLVEKKRLTPKQNSLDDLTWKEALSIGVYQCLALWPGMSRSASTILGGMMSGVDRKTATEYSFFAAVPVMFAAVLFDLFKGRHLLSFSDFPFFAAGFAVSFLTAWIVIRVFVGFLSKHTLASFGWYRIIVALAVLLFPR